jgi:hypothetical protein
MTKGITLSHDFFLYQPPEKKLNNIYKTDLVVAFTTLLAEKTFMIAFCCCTLCGAAATTIGQGGYFCCCTLCGAAAAQNKKVKLLFHPVWWRSRGLNAVAPCMAPQLY